MPAISVVIPCYNAENFISEAIESVLSQTFTDFELIIIDDGSTDNSVDVIRSRYDKRIVLIENKHESIVSALNSGFERATGKYITRMDADDRMFPERLKTQYELMESRPEITVCSSWMQLFNSNGAGETIKNGAGIVEYPIYKLLNHCIVFHPTTMIRRDFLEKHNLQYEYYPYAEDYKLWFEIAKRNGIFYIIPQPLLYYRISENQVSYKYSKEQRQTSVKIQKEILSYLMPKFSAKNITVKIPVKPDISVIMPTYNSEKYIREAIDGILRQTFENFEFIIINDNSDDNTGNILKSLKDKRIKIINNSCREGNYRSRNRGLEIASGKYICIMDSDDISTPERFEKQYRFMEENAQYAAIGSDIVVFGENTVSIQRLRNDEEIKVELLRDNVCTHPTLMLRSEFLKQNKIRYNENYYYAADYNLLADISRTGKITNLPEYLLFYRRHKEQISFSKNIAQWMFKNRIQLKQLESFKIRPSIDEIIIHNALMNRFPLFEKQQETAEKWCNKLLIKNCRLNIFNQEHLYGFLEKRFTEALRNRV